EAAAVITVLVLLGQVLELRARESTSGAIRALLDLAPKTARIIRDDGTEEEVQLDTVQAGNRLRVRPGEKVPVDGEVLEGRSAVDESMVTGESMPVTKEAGAKAISGTMNQSGALVIEARKVGRDTMLSQIVQLVAEAQRSRAPIQRMADQVSGWFVPAVIVVALLAFAAWGIWCPCLSYLLEDDFRKGGHQHDEEQHGDDEGDAAAEYLAERHVARHRLDDEDVDAHGRRHQPDLGHEHDIDAEPDRVDAELQRDREQHRHGQDHHPERVEKTAEDQ